MNLISSQKRVWSQKVCHWLSYLQWKERFNLNEKSHDFESVKNKFETILCANSDPLVAKVCKRLLKLNLENEYILNIV